MRILVTGGAGYIGSHTLRLLLAQGHDAWAYDNLAAGHAAAVPAGWLIRGELGDAAALDDALGGKRVEAVVHFAALALVPESVRSPGLYYRNNVAGTLGLMEAMQRNGVSRIVFSSTCATYGVPAKVPITEDEPQRPINPYGNTKLAIKMALRDFAAAHGWGVAILRYFNAAGASPEGGIGEDHDPETHLIPIVLQAVQGRRPAVDVFGTDYPTPDGTCVRDYIHVDDLADAHALALGGLVGGEPIICNLGTGRGHSVREVIRAAEEVTGRPVPTREAGRRPGDPPALVADASHAAARLGWTPKYTSLRRIIETAWGWHRGHPDGYGGR